MSMTKDAYYDYGYHTKRHVHMIAEDEYFLARAEASARLYFTPAEQQRRILEYGCGMGQTIATLPSAAGWDISAEAREVCRRRHVRVYDELSDVPKKEWDIVFCRHVLEHVESPLDALRNMRELVTEDGDLYLILPQEHHAPPRAAPDVDQHLFCWTHRTANNLLRRAGFEPYANHECYVLGYRVLLPVRRLLGKNAYYHACRLVGHLLRNAELIIRARPV